MHQNLAVTVLRVPTSLDEGGVSPVGTHLLGPPTVGKVDLDQQNREGGARASGNTGVPRS